MTVAIISTRTTPKQRTLARRHSGRGTSVGPRDHAKARFRQAIAQNNQAVVLIKDGHYSQAISTLSSSLRVIKSLFARQQETSRNSSSYSSSSSSSVEICSSETSDRDESDTTASTAAIITPVDLAPPHLPCISPSRVSGSEQQRVVVVAAVLQDHEASMTTENEGLGRRSTSPRPTHNLVQIEHQLLSYQTPFLIDHPRRYGRFLAGGEGEEQESSDEETATSLASMSAIVIFNLALSKHLSITTSQTATASSSRPFPRRVITDLETVLHLYELSLELADGIPSDTDLPLVVVNNLGVLLVQLQSYDEAFRYFRYLTMVLMYVVDRRLGLDDQDRLEFLLQNALLATTDASEHSAFAAAA